MLKISKLTDYSTVVMAYLAQHPEKRHNVRDITAHTQIAAPTASKILKHLAKHGLVVSHRGIYGGYSLARPAEEISVASIIIAMEGEPALTECSEEHSHCFLESQCALRGNWRTISQLIYDALEEISLVEMSQPLHGSVIHLDSIKKRINPQGFANKGGL